MFREGVDLSLHANVPDPAPTRLEAMLEEHCDLIRSEAELAIAQEVLCSSRCAGGGGVCAVSAEA